MHYGLKNISCSRYNYLYYHFTLLTYYFNVSLCVIVFHRVSECSNFSKHQFLLKILSFRACIQLERHCLLWLILLKTFKVLKVFKRKTMSFKKSFTCLLLKFFNVFKVFFKLRQNLFLSLYLRSP